MNFIFPEKPKLITKPSIVPKNYLMQVKKNGWRVEIICENDKLELYNRHGELIHTGREFDWSYIKDIFPQPFYLDGEIVGARQKGEFSDTIVIWDCIIMQEKLFKVPYIERYNMLDKFSCNWIPDNVKAKGTKLIAQDGKTRICLSENYMLKDFDKIWSEFDKIWSSLDKRFDEGVVFKNPSAVLNWNYTRTGHSINQLKMLK